ncbi:IS5 family transposase [Paenibacillus sp. JMULE4]|uniref:IS5 family transposase n=1 Tax=Paenibacillus TaxID=44249 RepID=UPI00088E6001|nr:MULTISPECIES: IS5 family transposase [Paenibacillus]NTZ16052.1 IS5 family transposase [Paenibacillus sp. JMULE4]NTZ16062.1 IS5 family transposase [Paenibacillus sp. JMULE4]NTZ18759.1 IS5 family transposase [Paenibacillus sp. JMULE4]NTZ18917.1 IS5 family transposase [Paenibacillus sp. JMULE4]SDJ44015.1 Transposase domain [Paenibacillus naphthalenovorans]
MFVLNRDMADLLENFYLPFGGKLNPTNRWVQLASIIPWDKVEEKYVSSFQSPIIGQKAYPARIALGSLIIKERLGLSDRETTLQIQENPYLQFFLGYTAYVDEVPFHHSLLTHFRERLGLEILAEVNDWIAQAALQAEREAEAKPKSSKRDRDDDDNDAGGSQLTMEVGEALTIPEETPATAKKSRNIAKRFHVLPPASAPTANVRNKGTLMLDATCAPADIKYPTDLGLLNHAREILEDIIDILHHPHIGVMEKPRTYREKARKSYLGVSKQRKASGKVIRKAIKKQLGYVGRDLRIIEALVEHTPLTELSKRHYRQLLIISELYRQQREMMEKKIHVIADRIVSIQQPHVRPMVRGKAGTNVEFGAKIAASLVDGYAWIETVEWDSFNEATTLQASAEAYKQRFGYYPAVILADKIYRNRDNLNYCKELGIRLSGPKLGRPSKEQSEVADRRQERQDAAQRNAIEGKFGEGKRKLGLGRIHARGAETSLTVIALQFLVMNLERRLRVLFLPFFKLLGFRGLRWV